MLTYVPLEDMVYCQQPELNPSVVKRTLLAGFSGCLGMRSIFLGTFLGFNKIRLAACFVILSG